MRVRLGLVMVLALVVVSCTRSEEADLEPVNAPPLPFVVIGAGQSDGGGMEDDLRNLWARQVFQELPRRSVYVNLAREGATAASAIENQLPEAADLEPAVVTVWLVSADAVAETAPEAFRRDLTALVSAFDTQTDVVLVASWSEPERPGEEPYVDVARDVAAVTPAILVDLADVRSEAPDAQERVADRVLAAIRSG